MAHSRARHAAWILVVALAACSSNGAPLAAPVPPQADAARTSDGRFRVMYRFKPGTDAQVPLAGLIAVNGALYGTTAGGGAYACDGGGGCGTAYKLALSGSKVAESVIYSVDTGRGPAAPLFAVGDALYGTTQFGCRTNRGGSRSYGMLFELTPSGSSYRENGLYCFKALTGSNPVAALLEVRGKLYGTDTFGASGAKAGAVFEVSLSGTNYRTVHRFRASSDGSSPQAPLVAMKGSLYGTTEGGGGANYGTVYQLRPSRNGDAESVVYSFIGGNDGRAPLAGLTEMNGALYGTTADGGGSGCFYGWGCGAVFKLTPSTSGFTESIVYRFGGSPDGGNPGAALLEARGRLYGTTSSGGNTSCDKNEGCGTVFELTPSGSGYRERVLHRFTGGSGGYRPVAGLTSMNGSLYGTTSFGGDLKCEYGSGCGTVFSIQP